MTRTFTTAALAVLLGLVVPGAHAQSQPPAWEAHSGDTWIDRTLADVNQYGRRYPDAFLDELARYDGAPRALVLGLLGDGRWAPGDIYFACALAQAAGQPCRAVVDMRNHDQAQRWGTVAQQLGVAPGSIQFQRIRRGLVDSYAHWGRPLPDDAMPRPGTPARPSNAREPIPGALPPPHPPKPGRKQRMPPAATVDRTSGH